MREERNNGQTIPESLQSDYYTGRNATIKAITLEIKPTENTKRFLDERQIVANDTDVYNRIKATIPFYDDMIIDCTDRACEALDYDLKAFAKVLSATDEETTDEENTNEKKEKKAVDAFKKAYTKAITAQLGVKNASTIAADSFAKGKLCDWLTAQGRLDDRETLRSFDKYNRVYRKMLVSRITCIETTMPERAVENFRQYLENIPKIEAFLESDFAREFYEDFREECDAFTTIDGYALCMTSKGLEAYNRMVNGIHDENGIVKKGLKNRIEETNHAIRTQKLKMPYFKTVKKLKKQVLVRTGKQFTVKTVRDDEEAKEALYNILEETTGILADIRDYLTAEGREEAGTLLFSGQYSHQVSKYITDDHKLLPGCLRSERIAEIHKEYEGKKQTERNEKAKENKIRKAEDHVNKTVYSVSDAQRALGSLAEGNAAEIITDRIAGLCLNVENCMAELPEKTILAPDWELKDNKKNRRLVVDFFRALKELRDLVRTFAVTGNTDKPTHASERMEEFSERMRPLNRTKNSLYSYVSKKNIASPKQQIFLGDPLKLGAKYWSGESFRKEQNIIIRMDNMYYFFTLDKKTKPITWTPPENDADRIEALLVQRLADPLKDLPQRIFTNAVCNAFRDPHCSEFVIKPEQNASFVSSVTVPRTVYEIRKKRLYVKECMEEIGEEKHRRNVTAMIHLYMRVLKAYKTSQNFDLSDLKAPEEYESFVEFTNDVKAVSTYMEYVPVSRKQLMELEKNGSGYLFLITNDKMYKDKAHGYDRDYDNNTYSRDFLAALSEENLSDMNIRLNSRPTFYFRKAAMPDTGVTHKKGEPMLNKHTLDGRYVPDNGVRAELKSFLKGDITKYELSDEAYSLAFTVKDGKEVNNLSTTIAPKDLTYKEYLKRDKYLITFTIAYNTAVSGNGSFALIEDARAHESEHGRVITITRDADHLLYYIMTDKDGTVLDEQSLNVIDGQDFKQKLRYKTEQKRQAQEDWSPAVSAGDIKQTFLRKAVHFIAKLAVDNNARIVVEHVGFGRRSANQMFDDRIYGTFIEQLKRKLNTYTDKEITKEKGAKAPGGLLNPLQLTVHDGKGNNAGFVCEEYGGYTATMCPDSGFVNLFDTNTVNTIHDKREFFGKFDQIAYKRDENGAAVVFGFDYKNFPDQTRLDTPVSAWTITASGERNIRIAPRRWEKKDIAIYLAGELRLEPKDTDILSMLGDLTGAQINALWEVFTRTLFGKEYGDKENGYKTSYISPVTGKRSAYTAHAVRMLEAKHRFITANWEEAEDCREKDKDNGINLFWISTRQERA